MPRLAHARCTRVAASLVVLLALTFCHREAERQKAREAELVRDLATIRGAITAYHRERGVFPPSLQELVASHHLRQLPVDPMTGARDWRVTTEETVQSDDFSSSAAAARPATVVVDVHSNARGSDESGKRYADY